MDERFITQVLYQLLHEGNVAAFNDYRRKCFEEWEKENEEHPDCRDPLFFPINFKGFEFRRSVNLCGINLSCLNFEGASFGDIDLSCANLSDAYFRGAVFLKTRFAQTQCLGTNFDEAIFWDAPIFGANFEKASFVGTLLRDVDSALMVAQGAELSRAVFDPKIIDISNTYRRTRGLPVAKNPKEKFPTHRTHNTLQ